MSEKNLPAPEGSHFILEQIADRRMASRGLNLNVRSRTSLSFMFFRSPSKYVRRIAEEFHWNFIITHLHQFISSFKVQTTAILSDEADADPIPGSGPYEGSHGNLQSQEFTTFSSKRGIG